MKRALKIFGWTLLGLVLIVIAVACFAVYVVFTPERLTPIAREAAAKYITCEHEIGEVDLTFFSTFPRFGLRADGLLLINPKSGAQNDTVVAAKRIVATVDVMEFLNHKNLHVHEAILDDARVNFFMAADGSNNLEVFVTSPDTAQKDTSAFALPFNKLQVDGLSLKANYITFVDDKDTIEASLGQTKLNAKAASWDDMLLTLDAQDVCARLRNEDYADHLHVELVAPLAMDLNTMHFALDEARLAVNEFDLRLGGEVTIGDSLAIDAKVETATWQIEPLLALVPAKFMQALKDIRVDGKVQLNAQVQGIVSEQTLPHIQANLNLTEGKGSYQPLPYELKDVVLKADADLRMNKGERSSVAIHSLKANTKQSSVAAKGTINDLLGDMSMNLALDLDANLPDFAYFMPKNMDLTGRAQGKANARMRLSDLTEMHPEKGHIDADLLLSDIRFAMDSMEAELPKTKARIQLPNPTPSRQSVNWARIDLETDKIDFEMNTPLKTALQASAIQLEAGNMLSKDPVLYAAVGLQTEQPLRVAMDSMDVTINAPKIKAYAEYNTKDTTVIPVLEAQLDCQALNGYFKDIKADLQPSHLQASLGGSRSDKTIPVLRSKLNAQAAEIHIGSELAAKTGTLALEAGSRYNANEENMLLKWNPRLKVNLKNGELSIPERLPEAVRIPSIEFAYSNREMTIENSRLEVGHSDLNLKGHVRNMGKWFRHEDILEGELDIISDHCDANQLLAWFSADKGSEEEAPSAEGGLSANKSERSNSDSAPTAEGGLKEPFLVPTDVDLALNTHIREVEIFEQVAKDLKGGLFVREGKLILDEVGFICHAAKLQLTAIYRTPRRNHLYVGLDYHMLDVNIDELLAMIPDLKEMVPMLSSFKGNAQFHLAAETYLNSQYEPKISTLRGAASLSGANMVVLDGETFTKISKLLMFNKKTENVIDSINAEITVYKDEIDVYPLAISMDNYMVALGGRHKTDMTFDYDINVLKPIYLGVHVGGSMDNLQIKLAKCKFAKDFRPILHKKADTKSQELRRMIRQSMEKNVRIK